MFLVNSLPSASEGSDNIAQRLRNQHNTSEDEEAQRYGSWSFEPEEPAVPRRRKTAAEKKLDGHLRRQKSAEAQRHELHKRVASELDSDDEIPAAKRRRSGDHSSESESESESEEESVLGHRLSSEQNAGEGVLAKRRRIDDGLDELHRAYLREGRRTRYDSLTTQSVWVGVCQRMHEKLKRQEDREARSAQVRSRLEVCTDPMFGTEVCEGDLRLDAINHTLDSFRWTRTAAQVMFHNYFTQAMLKRVYGSSWEANAVRVLAEHGLTDLETEVMIMTPRRYGKTVAVSMWVVPALLHIPGIEIGIFSTGQRASSMLMGMAAGFLREIDGAERRIVKMTDRDLYVSLEPLPDGVSMKSTIAQQRKNLSTTSKLHSFPSTVESKFILCEGVGRESRSGLCVDGDHRVSCVVEHGPAWTNPVRCCVALFVLFQRA